MQVYLMPKAICYSIFLSVILNVGLNRVVGGPVTATHQPAESDGRRQPAATARHLAEFYG